MASQKQIERGKFTSTGSSSSNKQLKRIGRNLEGSDAVASWAAIPVEMLASLIVHVTDAGGAVQLGRSLDGGVLTLRIYHDSYEKQTFYIRPSQPESWSDLVAIHDEFASLLGRASWA